MHTLSDIFCEKGLDLCIFQFSKALKSYGVPGRSLLLIIPFFLLY